VYSLTSEEGWYAADTLIVSNCDCVHVPVTDPDVADEVKTDPRTYFDSLSRAEQDRIFTNAGAQAVRDGADLNQVVNARRGMYSAGSVGGTLSATTEGMTRRGFAGRPTGPLGKGGFIRLMPESIYQLSGSREETLRLLRRYGYLT
jgi:hypothetical protein